VRAALFILPFAVLMIAGVEWWLSLIVALAFAFAASMVFFPQLREAAARDLQRMREGRRPEGAAPDDADVEDEVLDGPQAGPDDARDDPDASARP
jgi:hypothetical protein